VVGSGQVEVDRRDPRPQRLAQGARRLHRVECPLERLVGATVEIGVEQPAIVLGREVAVHRDVGEVEHRRAESSVLPIDQPQARTVVDEVSRQQVVVAEDRRQRHLHPLQRFGGGRVPRRFLHAAGAAAGERLEIAANDVERPERVHRPGEVARERAMAGPQHRDDPRDVRGEVRLRERPSFDVTDDDDPGLRMDDLRREAGGAGGAARGDLPVAEDAMDRNVIAASCHIPPRAVVDPE
jgi:hypothetical protein